MDDTKKIPTTFPNTWHEASVKQEKRKKKEEEEKKVDYPEYSWILLPG